LTPQG
ncbi:hypothetical protein EE612_025077, partial [Oryza sativa]